MPCARACRPPSWCAATLLPADPVPSPRSGMYLAQLKDEGNELFKAAQFEKAIGKYTEVRWPCRSRSRAGQAPPADRCTTRPSGGRETRAPRRHWRPTTTGRALEAAPWPCAD